MTKNFYKTQLQKFIREALNQTRFLNKEIQILEYRNKIETDADFKKKHEAIKSRPIEPIQTFTIPKPPAEGEMEYCYWNKRSQLPKFSQEYLTGLTAGQIREEAALRVFQPGHGQPTKSINQSVNEFVETYEAQ